MVPCHILVRVAIHVVVYIQLGAARSCSSQLLPVAFLLSLFHFACYMYPLYSIASFLGSLVRKHGVTVCFEEDRVFFE